MALQRIEKILKELEQAGRYRRLSGATGIDFSSNDYLGLSTHPLLRAKAIEALENGLELGAAGSRLLRGNHPAHEALEAQAAQFFQSPRALFFANGFQANSALFTTLPSRHDTIIFDSLIHASARDGIQASQSRHIRAAHNDLNTFEEALKKAAATRRPDGEIWLAVESVYSMDGDIAPLQQLHQLCAQYEAWLIVDEAHATGVWGKEGRGLSYGLSHERMITLHTCGKALGVSGGLVCAPENIIEYLINAARPFIYSTAPMPLQAVLVGEAIKLLPNAEITARRAHLHQLCSAGQKLFGGGGTQIIPLILGEDQQAARVAAHLQSRGLDVRAIRPPTVPAGSARLRLSLNAGLKEEDLNYLAETLNSLQDIKTGTYG